MTTGQKYKAKNVNQIMDLATPKRDRNTTYIIAETFHLQCSIITIAKVKIFVKNQFMSNDLECRSPVSDLCFTLLMDGRKQWSEIALKYQIATKLVEEHLCCFCQKEH